ncbi:MAG: PaaI family thioesterase [Burkholderiales bacterium]
MTQTRKQARGLAVMQAQLEREMFKRGVPRALDMHLLALSRKKVVAEMRIGARHLNRSARINGGAIMAFADIVGAAGTVANLPAGHRTSTLESKTNFFAAGHGPRLKAVAVPLHIGRTTMVWQTTISDADGRKVAIVTQTQIVIPETAASGGRDTKRPRRK